MKLITANLGNGSDRQVRGDLLHLMCLGDMICTQESLDRLDEIDVACEYSGWDWYKGEGAGRTVVMWDKHLPVHRQRTVVLNGRTDTDNPPGPRDTAGPDVVNAKELVLVRVQGFGWVGSAHLPASLWWPPRMRLAKRDVAAMVDFVEPRFHVAIGADWNTRPERPVLDPLRKAGMVSTQDFKRIGTRGAAPIDAFMYKGLVCVDVDTVETSGDHDPVIADLRRKERL